MVTFSRRLRGSQPLRAVRFAFAYTRQRTAACGLAQQLLLSAALDDAVRAQTAALVREHAEIHGGAPLHDEVKENPKTIVGLCSQQSDSMLRVSALIVTEV